MAFGSGGTMTALAETNIRVAGDGKNGSLSILRRTRLKALLELLITIPAKERASLISGDPKRADIIVAGGLVLYEIMSEIGLDYIFVSRRGLRDGLMIDLLQRHYRKLRRMGSGCRARGFPRAGMSKVSLRCASCSSCQPACDERYSIN